MKSKETKNYWDYVGKLKPFDQLQIIGKPQNTELKEWLTMSGDLRDLPESNGYTITKGE